MDNCYREVNTEVESGNAGRKCVKITWRPFWRQLFICTGLWTSYFAYGLCIGAPTVFIPQIRNEANSTAAVTDDMASWLSSLYFLAGSPWVIVLAMLTAKIGRRICFIIACIDSFVAFLILFYSTTITHIVLSQIIQGFCNACNTVISVSIVTEYMSPRHRGLFLTVMSATFYWGVWASNAIGTFLHWKQIALIGLVCSVYTVAISFFWPESPYWFASKGRFEDCAYSHRWLKGRDEESDKELEDLINTQKECIKNCPAIFGLRNQIIDVYNTFKCKSFYKPTLISLLTSITSIFTGKMICTVYAIDILKKITGSESTAYTGMLILDGITVLGMYFGCILAKWLKRRTLLLTSAAIVIVILLIISSYLYIIKLSLIIENTFVSISLISLSSIAISCGPLLMSISTFGELIPVRSRNLSMCVVAIGGKISLGSVIKISPFIFRYCGLHGTFLLFGIGSSASWYLLYKYLPETKDKTLQEISDSMVRRNTGVLLK